MKVMVLNFGLAFKEVKYLKSYTLIGNNSLCILHIMLAFKNKCF